MVCPSTRQLSTLTFILGFLVLGSKLCSQCSQVRNHGRVTGYENESRGEATVASPRDSLFIFIFNFEVATG